jgi:hypothetical protein
MMKTTLYGEISTRGFVRRCTSSTKCESGEPPTIYFVGAFFVLTMPLPER